jgi:predicted metalloprotease
MQYKYTYNQLASTYGSSSYNNSTYNGQSTGATTGGGTSSGGSAAGGGALVNTGVAIAVIVTLAAIVLLVAIIVRVWKRPSKNVAATQQPVVPTAPQTPVQETPVASEQPPTTTPQA